jgi:Xaa-Pro aminopeptidase
MNREKIAAVRKEIGNHEIDAFLVTNPINRRYLSGFSGSSGLLLISKEKAYLLVDFRYLEQAANQAPDYEVVRRQEDLYPCLVGLIDHNGFKKIGFEAKNLVYKDYQEMAGKLPAQLVPLEELVENLRVIKNAEELTILRRGATLLDEAFNFLKREIKPGMTEKELALELEIYLLRQGAEERSFKFIVASGPRGAMPHGTATEKILKKGELVTIDFGAIFDGYATDMTRTFSIGEPDQEMLAIYKIVYQAQREAVAAVRPGRKAKEIDAVSRVIITEAGYGDYFGHGLGHGVGLEVHEAPTLNTRSETELKPGMIITVEPGIYLPGKGGVRIEDMVHVTESGMELLTGSERELVII